MENLPRWGGDTLSSRPPSCYVIAFPFRYLRQIDAKCRLYFPFLVFILFMVNDEMMNELTLSLSCIVFCYVSLYIGSEDRQCKEGRGMWRECEGWDC